MFMYQKSTFDRYYCILEKMEKMSRIVHFYCNQNGTEAHVTCRLFESVSRAYTHVTMMSQYIYISSASPLYIFDVVHELHRLTRRHTMLCDFKITMIF